ncbi:MAG: acyl-CoA dehydrogenase [Solirubrobacterales bacterium]|nr:acyl-CoA dehydrogenase [Solirubrobacterales bacterium]
MTTALRSTLLSRRDLQFLLHEWLGVEDLPEYGEVLELAERIATDQFATHNREADENEPHVGEDGTVQLVDGVAEALAVFHGSGMGGAGMPGEVGGMGLPSTVSIAAFAYFQAANVGTAAYPMLTTAAANLLLQHGSQEQIEKWAVPMVEGRFSGTMCLSETQAGSSLSDITTRAEPQDDGSYRVTGSKMWISGGEHELTENIVHLVLAKIPGGPAGVKGISLMLVPRYLDGEPNGVVLAGLNHKMGYRGTVNTVLSFEGATGYLVGEPHRGLAYMFAMMNEARVGVGLGATALGYTGYLKSLQYARERPQGRPIQSKDPAEPQIPIVEHADVKRMLLAQKSYVEGALALILYCSKLVDDGDEELLDMLTPIAKAWPAQWCLEANSLAIQIHGGYGYAREYEVEQHYRDNRLNPIHEGTNGIQGLDLLGRKVTQNGGAGLGRLAEAINGAISRAHEAGGEAAELGSELEAALGRLLETTGALWAEGAAGVEATLANATIYLEAAGHVVIAWMWLEQLLAAGAQEGGFYDGKRAAARYFFRYELPRTGPQFDLLATRDRTTLEMEDAWF